MHPVHPRWNGLLDWLGSHGMSTEDLPVEARERPGVGFGLYATRSSPPSTPLLEVPASALLNSFTLSPFYPRLDPPLTAFQLISLHLTLHRPKDSKSSDPLFGPYISILPPDFAYHPLTWLHRRIFGLASANEELRLDLLPTSVLESLIELYNRFRVDWERVSNYLKRHQNLYPLFQSNDVDNERRFLWAWLNVNTRCIYYRGCNTRSDPDNISLCPILDFANHTASGPHMLPKYVDAGLRGVPPGSRQADVTLVSPALLVGENEEMYLMYGAHCNKRLFVEYGFINQVSMDILAKGNVVGEVDVQKHIENLFRKRKKIGEWMEKVLREEGYWGDWTMHSGPGHAHPSFRLITALRLYHAFPLVLNEEPPSSLLRPWKDTLLGTREYVSEENEGSWRETLVQICSKVEAEAEKGMLQTQEAGIRGGWGIEELWVEELHVAREVKKSVEAGVSF